MPLPKQQHKLQPQPHCKQQPLQQQLPQTTPWLPLQALRQPQPPLLQPVQSLQQPQTCLQPQQQPQPPQQQLPMQQQQQQQQQPMQQQQLFTTMH
jgi:S-DNA-T family DNA segregation ATPase FtsK/SpoIIIE